MSRSAFWAAETEDAGEATSLGHEVDKLFFCFADHFLDEAIKILPISWAKPVHLPHLVKLCIADVLTPAAWKFVGRKSN